jgi:hypothetical protein
MKYLEEKRGVVNSFAEYGSYIHSILEKYYKDELSIFELSQYYEDNFSEAITEPFPPNKYVSLRDSYFEKGKQYLDNITELEGYKILGVEEKVKFLVEGYNFTGYIDLLVENENGDLEIIDHKSRDLKPRSSRKKPTKSDELLDLYLRQLYLYSIPVHNKYNKYPTYLNFNAFKEGIWIKEPFKIAGLEEAKHWMIDTIHRIENETEFKPNPDRFHCFHLCDFRHICEPFREE